MRLMGVSAISQLSRGETDEAGRLLQQALAISRKVLPPNHPDIATAHNNVALISMARRDFATAESEFRQALVSIPNFIVERDT